ncbi:hypothetical protein AAFF_G00274530 [Aldrovandia affinis]|uniref:Uncharacterized protein n=1 Tax=Aldrovandia affinis TaxID=143900 RepID=A0AAD7SS34_9TELE|nr:hypothetical protein AAFF_G00274530 [Aldrovandia affinis]
MACMEYPSHSCRQATMASFVVHPSLHTVPHLDPTLTSTRPSVTVRPPTSRICREALRDVSTLRPGVCALSAQNPVPKLCPEDVLTLCLKADAVQDRTLSSVVFCH